MITRGAGGVEGGVGEAGELRRRMGSDVQG
jgi:hypothetical protein